MKNIILLIVFSILLFLSCHKKKETIQNSTPDYLIFGVTASGFCVGPGVDCALIYKIEKGKLYADSMNQLDENHLIFQTNPRPYNDYLIAAPLIDNFPDYLLRNSATYYGCPNCYDQGKIFIQRKDNDVIRKWHLDTSIGSMPAEIRAFADSVMKKAIRLR